MRRTSPLAVLVLVFSSPPLDAGISVAAVTTTRQMDEGFEQLYAHGDEALDYLVLMADELGIDAGRIGTFGSSQGAGIAMWLGFRGQDSIGFNSDRSGRIRAVGNMVGQTTFDMLLWKEWIPGFTDAEIARLGAIFQVTDLLNNRPALLRVSNNLAAMANLSTDDPPLWMFYGMAPEAPLPTDVSQQFGWQIHHVNFGVRLQELADDIRVESYLNYPGRRSMYPSVASFLIAKLSVN